MKCNLQEDRRYNKMEDVIEDLKHSLCTTVDFVKPSADTDAKIGAVISDEELEKPSTRT